MNTGTRTPPGAVPARRGRGRRGKPRTLRAGCGLLLALVPLVAGAVGGFRVTPTELVLLPAYCRPLANRRPGDPRGAELLRWERVFGHDYDHMHHYCRALQYLLHSETALAPKRARDDLNVALSEMSYVEQKASPHFLLRHEMYHLKSVILERLGRRGLALQYAQRALEAKPGYLKGMLHLADLQVRAGKRARARSVLREAARRHPRSRAVRRRLACLAGKASLDCPKGYVRRHRRGDER